MRAYREEADRRRDRVRKAEEAHVAQATATNAWVATTLEQHPDLVLLDEFLPQLIRTDAPLRRHPRDLSVDLALLDPHLQRLGGLVEDEEELEIGGRL